MLHSPAMNCPDLIALASVRTGVNDWSIVWIDVHLGNATCVSVCVQSKEAR
jgi:hypothetical protein